MSATLTTRERIAVAIGGAGLAEGLAAALFAPHVSVFARAARIAIDLTLAAGFVAYVRGDRAATASRSSTSRTFAVVLIAAGGLFALSAPGVDGWRRAFRVSIALALIAGIALGVGRAVPAQWSRCARVLAVLFVLVESVAGIAAALDIDLPVVVAGLAPLGRHVDHVLTGPGFSAPAPVRDALVRAAPRALATANDRLVATPALADEFHLLSDDPVPVLARIFSEPATRAAWKSGRLDECILVRTLRPPLAGYRDSQYEAGIRGAVRACR